MTGTRDKIRSLFLATLMVLSVFGGTIAFSGATAAQSAGNWGFTQDTDPTEQKNNQYDETLTSSGGPYWQGQRLVIQAQNVGTSTLQIRESVSKDGGGERLPSGSLVREVNLNNNDAAIINTAGLEGSYVITTGSGNGDVINFENGAADGTPHSGYFANDGTVSLGSGNSVNDAVELASFEVTSQNLDASFQSAESAQEKIFLEVDSARGDSDLLVTADGLDDDEVVEIFNDEFNTSDDDNSVQAIYDASDSSVSAGDQSLANAGASSSYGDGVVFDGVDSQANISANFNDIDTGDYEFEFEVTDTGVSDSSSVTVSDEEDVDAEILNGGVATAAQGDFAVVPIQLEETDTARVNLGFNDVNFNASFQVEDGNDDGLVTVEINTRYAGLQNGLGQSTADDVLGAALTVSDNQDSVTIPSGSDWGMWSPSGGTDHINSPMDADQYDINVTHVDDINNEFDVGTVQIVEPSVDGITSWTMPSNVFSDVEEDETAELYEYIQNGELTESDSVAKRDVLVFQIQSTSMFGELKAAESASGVDYADALNQIASYNDSYDSANGKSFKFLVEQTSDTTRANTDPKQVDLAASAGNGVKVVPDERNSSLFVVMKENNLQLTRTLGSGSSNLEMAEGDAYEANWTVFDNTGLDSDNAGVTDTAEITEKSIDFDTDAGGVIRVAAAPGQVISGSTSVAPGTELNVRLRSTGDTPFLEDPEAIVQPDGTFNATVDLSDRAQNASFSANAQGFDSDFDTPGVIGQAPTADVDFEDQTVENGSVTVDATLSDGGFISLRTGSPDGEIVGASEYLGEGDNTATIDVDPLSEETELYAVAHQDTNDNEALDFEVGGSTDGPYTTSNGTVVSDSAMISPQDDTETTTEQQTTEEPTTEDTETDAPETDGGDDGDEETTAGDGAGFTAVIALVALLAAALIAVRRD